MNGPAALTRSELEPVTMLDLKIIIGSTRPGRAVAFRQAPASAGAAQ